MSGLRADAYRASDLEFQGDKVVLRRDGDDDGGIVARVEDKDTDDHSEWSVA